MSAAENAEGWELVHDEPGKSVRRYPVPGGWLYQCESTMVSHPDGAAAPTHHRAWATPVFVPMAWRTP